MKIKIALILSALLAETLAQQVNTPDGPVKGIAEQSVNGNTYYAYYTIPYAKPPTGSRRFQASEAVDPWTEVYDATYEKPVMCYQLYDDNDRESEDCLFINVYTPQDPWSSGQLRPVMVNIHGGGFVSGSGMLATGGFSPKYLIEEDIVIASFNYRLGAFGFLSTGDNVIPGNAGLTDQIAALKWVQKNIAAFGGDPNRVTILGQSAGGASVGYMLLSPLANGLFAGAILESGTPLCPWAYQRNQTTISFLTGSMIDSQFQTNRDSGALLSLLQSVDAKAVDTAAISYANWDAGQPGGIQRASMQQGFKYTPVIDNVVIPEYQYEALAEGNLNRVPTLIGICSEEGLVNMGDNLDYLLNGLDQDPANMNPQDLHVNDEPLWKEVGEKLKQEYSPWDSFISNKLGGIQYFTDHDFAKAAVKHAELQSSYSDVYFYEFAYSGRLGGNTDHQYPGSGNVSHVEEWVYLFGGWPLYNYSQEDQLVHSRMVKIWSNFAKYLNPTPSQDQLLQNIIWPKVQPGQFGYVEIGNFADPNLNVVQNKPKAERMNFWEQIYNTYGNRPYDTY